MSCSLSNLVWSGPIKTVFELKCTSWAFLTLGPLEIILLRVSVETNTIFSWIFTIVYTLL
jgi:hypothetical protein